MKNFPEKKMSRFFLKFFPRDESIAIALLAGSKEKTCGKRYPSSQETLSELTLVIDYRNWPILVKF